MQFQNHDLSSVFSHSPQYLFKSTYNGSFKTSKLVEQILIKQNKAGRTCYKPKMVHVWKSKLIPEDTSVLDFSHD